MVLTKLKTCAVCDKEIHGDDEFAYWVFTEGYMGNEIGEAEVIHEKCKTIKKDGKIIAFLEGYEDFNYKNKEDL